MENKTDIKMSMNSSEFEHAHLHLCESQLNPYNVSDTEEFNILLNSFLHNIMKFTDRLVLETNIDNEDEDLFEITINTNNNGDLYVTINDDWEDDIVYPQTHSIELTELVEAVKRPLRLKYLFSFELDKLNYSGEQTKIELNKYSLEKYHSVKIGDKTDKYFISRDLLFNFDKYPHLATIYTLNVLAGNFETIKKIETMVIDVILSKGFIHYSESRGFTYIDEFDLSGNKPGNTTLNKFIKGLRSSLKNQIVPSESGHVEINFDNMINSTVINESINDEQSPDKVIHLYYSRAERIKERYRLEKELPRIKEPMFINVEGEEFCIANGKNVINAEITITPKVYAPVRRYLLEIQYRFTDGDRLQYIRDFSDTYIIRKEVFNVLPITVVKLDVYNYNLDNENDLE